MRVALDLFCGAGGAARGLQQAGFYVVGVDNRPQPRYAGDLFVQADALNPPFDLAGFDLIWASPPCQAYSTSTAASRSGGKTYPDLIARVRKMLDKAALPFCIENVAGAPLTTGVMLCGGSFGLGAICSDGLHRSLRRHRHFETTWPMLSPPCGCDARQKIGVYGSAGHTAGQHGYKGSVDEAREALEMPWATQAGLSQAIPPAYAEYIGKAALQYMDAA